MSTPDAFDLDSRRSTLEPAEWPTTAGVAGTELCPSAGMRRPGITLGATGRSFKGLERRLVGTERETKRWSTPREDMDPPFSTMA